MTVCSEEETAGSACLREHGSSAHGSSARSLRQNLGTAFTPWARGGVTESVADEHRKSTDVRKGEASPRPGSERGQSRQKEQWFGEGQGMAEGFL